MKEFLYLLIGSLFSGVIVYVVKGFFTNNENRVLEIKKDFDEKAKSLDSKIDKINDGHASIYNDILNKFSNWEDRIKKILDESISKQVQISPCDFNKSIVDSFSELDKEIKRDMASVKRDIDVMNFHIKKTEEVINSMKIDSTEKTAIRDMLRIIKKIEDDKNKQLNEMESKLIKIYSVCKVLISDNKEFDKKITILNETTKHKIKFME